MTDREIDRCLAEGIVRLTPPPPDEIREIVARLTPSIDKANIPYDLHCGALRRAANGSWWFGELALGTDDRPRPGLSGFEQGAIIVMIRLTRALEHAVGVLAAADEHHEAAALATVLDGFKIWDRDGLWPEASIDLESVGTDDVPTAILPDEVRCGPMRRTRAGAWFLGDTPVGHDDAPSPALFDFSHSNPAVTLRLVHELMRAITILRWANEPHAADVFQDVIDRFHVWQKCGSWPTDPISLERDPTSVYAARPDSLLSDVYLLVDRLLTARRPSEFQRSIEDLSTWLVVARMTPSPPIDWAPRPPRVEPPASTFARLPRFLGTFGLLGLLGFLEPSLFALFALFAFFALPQRPPTGGSPPQKR